MFRIASKQKTLMKLSFIAGLLVLVVVCMGIVAPRALAADCDNNAIIKCGFSSPGDFINKARANNSNNGHHDLQTIYAAYGLEPAEYDRFVRYARPGTAYKDGRIVVDGQVVATNARSIGRQAALQGSGYFSQNIGGTTYYGNSNARAFVGNSIPVNVLFNSKGVMEFAVLTSCGNPETGTLVTPTYGCNNLQKTAVAGKLNTYSFTTSANAGNNARITKLVYDFGDGATATTTNPATRVTHAYSRGGTYTAKVTVYVSLPGSQTVTVTNGGCQTTIVVTIPFYECAQLSGAILDRSRYSYSFTATATYGNGAKLVSADFVFGDGTSRDDVQPATPTTFTVSHTYAKAGNYSASAVLQFATPDGRTVTAPACKAAVTPTTPPTPECKPGIPVGSPDCLPPCQPGSAAPPGSPECTPPTLPNTGAGNTIAIFAAVVVGALLVYRHILFRRHRTAFLAAERGTSPLPLGNPLDVQTPLNGTPLQPQQPVRSTFRRRPF